MGVGKDRPSLLQSLKRVVPRFVSLAGLGVPSSESPFVTGD